MKYYLTSIVLFFSSAYAQNIIPDPGFEEIPSGSTLGDPTSSSQCDYASSLAFDADMTWWKTADHNNDKGNLDPSLINDNVVTCYNDAYFACSHTFAPSKVHALIEATIFKENECDNSGGDDSPHKFHEAIRIGFNDIALTNNITYTLRYKFKATRANVHNSSYGGMNPNCYAETDFCHLRVFFAEHGENWNNTIGNDQFEAISANIQRTFSENNCEWEYVERTFTVPSSGIYKNLILYAESGGFAIDDVELFPSCTSNYYIQNKDYSGAMANESGGIYKEKVSNEIVAGYDVGAWNIPLGNVLVKNDAIVIFTAGNQISLQNGFGTEYGAEFTAVIDNCPNSRFAYTGINKFTTNSPSNKGNIAENAIERSKKISIYPNPNFAEFTLSIRSDSGFQTSMYLINLSGKIFFNQPITVQPGTSLIPVKKDLPAGIYFVRVDGFDEIVKIIVM